MKGHVFNYNKWLISLKIIDGMFSALEYYQQSKVTTLASILLQRELRGIEAISKEYNTCISFGFVSGGQHLGYWISRGI